MDNLGERVKKIRIEEELKNYYLDYAMSVNIGRSIPYATDGLKPVHRRILYAMYELGNMPNKPYKKSARVVGDVLGKYHPHGETAIYDSLVRMAQDFTFRYPLVDGQGNFGSVDGDAAAAMRYTEVRLTKLATHLLDEIGQETVEWTRNFDNSLDEPLLLPAKLPYLLLNGSSGIGVGMACNIPPHNLSELVDCMNYLLDHSDATVDDILKIMPGPDFPTGGKIVSPAGVRSFYETGRGSIIQQGVGHIEAESRNKTSYVITEIPYMVNKANLVKAIADLVRNKKIDGITDLRDESDREGMRIVIELKAGVDWKVVEKKLFKHTQLQTTFGGILLSIVDGRPIESGIIENLRSFIEFRRETVVRRTKFQLKKAEERKHILEGLHVAITNIDETIKIIRGAESTQDAQQKLMDRFELSTQQAQAILDMRLARLTKLEVGKIEEEIAELVKIIKKLTEYLENPDSLKKHIKKEFLELKKEFADKRRSKFGSVEEADFNAEDLVSDDPMIVAITKDGYIKRVKPEMWRAQGRGGKGVTGLSTNESDEAKDIFSVTNKEDMLAFTNLGKAYKFKVYDIPEVGRTAKGTPITTLLPLVPSEFVSAILPIKEWDDRFLFMVTSRGIVKKLPLKSFEKVRRTGMIAITLDGDDWLKKSRPVDPDSEIIIVSKYGQAIRFNESDVRSTGRTSKGVIGIRLNLDDMVVAMEVEEEGASLLCVSENGYGKRTDFSEFRLIKRGGKGVRAMKINPKSGPVITCRVVKPEDHLFIITSGGQTIKIQIDKIRECGRNATGVRLIKLAESDTVTAISRDKPDINGNGDEEQEQTLESQN